MGPQRSDSSSSQHVGLCSNQQESGKSAWQYRHDVSNPGHKCFGQHFFYGKQCPAWKVITGVCSPLVMLTRLPRLISVLQYSPKFPWFHTLVAIWCVKSQALRFKALDWVWYHYSAVFGIWRDRPAIRQSEDFECASCVKGLFTLDGAFLENA